MNQTTRPNLGCWRRSSKDRSRHQSCSLKKGVLKSFSKFIRKHLCLNLLSNVAGPRPGQVFSREFCEFFRTPFLQNTSRRLLPKRAYWGLNCSLYCILDTYNCTRNTSSDEIFRDFINFSKISGTYFLTRSGMLPDTYLFILLLLFSPQLYKYIIA